ncbi:hypothetical protein [Oenococcus sicerae]|uniref:hypothetical protein n=1 Tax=Oenococcus sicerae TaxID=2203724 RepID=UPI0039E78745
MKLFKKHSSNESDTAFVSTNELNETINSLKHQLAVRPLKHYVVVINEKINIPFDSSLPTTEEVAKEIDDQVRYTSYFGSGTSSIRFGNVVISKYTIKSIEVKEI